MNIQELLQLTIDKKASDLHISSGISPVLRIDGDLKRTEYPALTSSQITKMLDEIMDDKQKEYYRKELETDFAFSFTDLTNFRVNAFNHQRGPGITFRVIPNKIPTLQELQLPNVLNQLCNLPNGLVLVTGPTGSGKSTTLAAMINYINQHHNRHIITIEDPIEFTFTCNNSLITQRELHKSTKSFSTALRSALREDPDVIVVGEMRDKETIHLALTAAETGHLVFATLHTNSAVKTIDRIIDIFPANEKEMIRAMLSESLRGVISQVLLKKRGGGRVAALELMLCTPAIRNLIRENKGPQIYSAIQTNKIVGMCTLAQYIQKLIENNLIDPKEEFAYTSIDSIKELENSY